ncbi:hypothetical protein Trydic_g3587 [Trypoxylus dichotomus]
MIWCIFLANSINSRANGPQTINLNRRKETIRLGTAIHPPYPADGSAERLQLGRLKCLMVDGGSLMRLVKPPARGDEFIANWKIHYIISKGLLLEYPEAENSVWTMM